MEQSAEDRVAEQMRLLRVRYLEVMKGHVAVLENALAACEAQHLSPDDRAALKTATHKLAGTGATYGFAQLSIVARKLDDRMINDPAAGTAALAALTRPVLEACRAAQATAEAPPELATSPQAPAEMRPQALSPAAPRTGFGRRSAEPSAPVAPTVRMAPDKAHLPLILVADDDEAVRSLFGSLFADDARVVFATNSDEALQVMRRTPPDLVLLDDIMPGAITGLKFLENLKASRELVDIPVVMITASDGETHIERGMRAGAVGYITKPFEALVVADWIRNLLKGLPALHG